MFSDFTFSYYNVYNNKVWPEIEKKNVRREIFYRSLAFVLRMFVRSHTIYYKYLLLLTYDALLNKTQQVFSFFLLRRD